MSTSKSLRKIIYVIVSAFLCIRMIRRFWPQHEEHREPGPLCASGILYAVQQGDTCDTISLAHKIPSHGLWEGNKESIVICDFIHNQVGMQLCIPFSCGEVYEARVGDTCESVEERHAEILRGKSFIKFNPWLQRHDHYCEQLDMAWDYFGKTYCLGYQGGIFGTTENVTNPVVLDENRDAVHLGGSTSGQSRLIAHA
ncbi:LysM peptidoglycan-binding domain-containing protein [Aspergillus affinis]|uniref:LysM peptidoglycan-binding domain-containing protein n=1 Tax=Aspergillus affinis TaxID=1070780 RepID=UPI0022FE8CB4|nr:uncharacterized protein KD926_007335 [Aspergillus affinis]KAI9041066.1 hypothetical protein KD926_007335 [Aspergillus affinis]